MRCHLRENVVYARVTDLSFSNDTGRVGLRDDSVYYCLFARLEEKKCGRMKMRFIFNKRIEDCLQLLFNALSTRDFRYEQ